MRKVVSLICGLGILSVVLLWINSDPSEEDLGQPAESSFEEPRSSLQQRDHLCKDCNIIFVSIDTLRADHLGCYGYKRPTTPNIDLFSRDSVLFRTAISQAPSTASSHASIFTSLIPAHHGVSYKEKLAITQNAKTMAELLRDLGYQTASFNGGGQVGEVFGFNRGFDTYKSFAGEDIRKELFVDQVNQGIEWMEGHLEEKFFLFLHSYEIHHPYTPTDKYLTMMETNYQGSLPPEISKDLLDKINKGEIKVSEEDKQHVINTYDAELRSVDESFKKLEEYLRSANLYDQSLIIVTSDHGEEFGEHGKLGWHSHSLFDELLKVPLLIKLPNSFSGGKVVPDLVRMIDVLPTVLDILGVESPAFFEGATLTPLIYGGKFKERVAVSQKSLKRPDLFASIRTERWKLYRKRLYDLEKDPSEQVDQRKHNVALADLLQQQLDQALQPKKLEQEKIKYNPQLQKQLESLGYM